jgi:EmrB/QacA subfamily drug resistance transporter
MSRRTWTLVAVVLGSGIVFLDGTVVNVALPRIGQELPTTLFGTLEAQNYVNNGFLATLSALLILAGALNDYYGRRRMFAIGLAGFGVASALCGLAPTMELLIVFRILQGAFGALLVPGSLSIITATFEGTERGRAIGIWAAASSAVMLVGPPIGGILVDSIGWRVAFLINVPLVAIAIYATLAYVTESRDDQATGRFDWLGAIVVVLAVGGLSFGAIRGQEQQWRDPIAYAALGIGAAATIAFPILMAIRPNPLVPLSLFRSRNFTVTNISTFLIYGPLYVTLFVQGLFLQGTLGYSPTAAGLVGLPVGAMLAVLSTPIGTLAGRYGPRWFMAVGPTIMGLSLLWLVRAPADSAAWVARPDDVASFVPPTSFLVDFLPMSLGFGLGLSIMVAPLTTALMSSVPVRHSGLASAINNAISRVGPQLIGALVFIVVTGSFYAALADRVPDVDVSSPEVRQQVEPLNPPEPEAPDEVAAAARQASTDAFHLAMLVAALSCFAGAAVNAVGIRNPQPDQRSAAEAEEPAPAAPAA